MDKFNSYFRTLVFTKQNTVQSYTQYVAVIHTMMGGTKKRCIILFVAEHLALKRTAYIKDLFWVNLQLREVDEMAFPLQAQSWTSPLKENVFGDLMLKVASRTSAYTTYKVTGFPYEILLINSSKKGTLSFQDSVNIYWALDQFSTIVNYLNVNKTVPNGIDSQQQNYISEEKNYDLIG